MCHSSWIKIRKVQPGCCLNLSQAFANKHTPWPHQGGQRCCPPCPASCAAQGSGLLLFAALGPLKILGIICWHDGLRSLFKHKGFHTFSLDRIGCTALLAGCLLPACTSVQIKNLSWHTGWWYYLLSLGETTAEGKWLKPEMSYWDSYFWKQWGRSTPGVGKYHSNTDMK